MTTRITRLVNSLLSPKRLYSRDELLENRETIPQSAGTYVWYIRPKAFPSFVPTAHCWRHAGLMLAYIGVTGPSSKGLYRRLHAHYNRDAGHSNFRLSLGLVLQDVLNLRLLPRAHPDFEVGGEKQLSAWLDENAQAAWAITEDRKTAEAIEDRILADHKPVLNTDGNEHPFAKVLKQLKRTQSGDWTEKHVLGWSISPA